MKRFFDSRQEEQILQAIREAERRTSGEIRVHLANQIEQGLMIDAAEVFDDLGMSQTAARNGVLIYLVPKAHRFAILGDEGINKVVPAGFWDDVRDLMQQHFRRREFTTGIVAAIGRVAEKLATYFPHQGEADENELPDDISYD